MANFLNDDIVHQRNEIEEMMMLVAAATVVAMVRKTLCACECVQ